VAVHVELLFKARYDLKRLGPGRDRKAVIDALTVGLTAIPPPGNLDIKALKGASPWLRLRVGDYRILYRPLTRAELKELEELSKWSELTGSPWRGRGSGRHKGPSEAGYLIARIVHRRDLHRAVQTLNL
jgi:mRNA-degrading endonuclease RelE of RelBE toxin-antitoxin system